MLWDRHSEELPKEQWGRVEEQAGAGDQQMGAS